MSDFFSGLFGGGGDSSGGGGGGFFGNLFGGGGDGSSPFDLSSIMGGDSGGGLGSLLSGGMGMQDPNQQAPTPAQTQQGGDPGGQLAGARPDQSQPGQQGGGQQKRDPFSDFGRILTDALKGNFQQPGYSNLTGLANQAQGQPPVPGQQGQPPGAVDPNAPTSSTASAGPAAPGQPQQGPTDAQGVPRGPVATVPKGITPGERTPTSLDPFTDPRQPTAPADQPKVPDKVLDGGQPAAPTGGAQPTGGQGNQFGQFMQSPLGQIVQMLIGQALGRMGPQGAMIAQMLRPALAQLAGQAGFGTGMRGPFPDYGGRVPATLPPNAGGPPGAGPGSPHEDTALPAGNDMNSLETNAARAAGIDPRIMSGIRAGESLRGSQYDVGDVRGRGGYHGGGPAYGPYQLNVMPGAMGDRFQKETGLDLRDPKTIPAQTKWVANWLKNHPDIANNPARLHAIWHGYRGPQTASARWGSSGYQGGGSQVAENIPPRIQPMPSPFDLNRRRRQRMSMGWQF